MSRTTYERPRLVSSHTMSMQHLAELEGSAIDFVTAGLGGVHSIEHGAAYDLGIRGDHDLGGLCFRYWQPWAQRFSNRFVRLKPDTQLPGRKYLQPVGEKPNLYFIAGTLNEDLLNHQLQAFLVEGEKKALALARALQGLSIPALVVGLGGVWGWRHSPRERQPDGKLGKGKSLPIGDLDRIRWTGRSTCLLFDSDASTNWKVATAETALAGELTRRGAIVRIARIRGGIACRRSA